MRTQVFFYCFQCNRQNYFSTKNKVKLKEKSTFKKFCKSCRKICLHKEKNK